MTLPQILPSQSQSFGRADKDGNVTIDVNWYLLLYNLWAQVIASGGAVNLSPAIALEMVEGDAQTTDIVGLPRSIANAVALLPDVDSSPSAADVANALLMGVDAQPPDPQQTAQAAVVVTVTASPFTYTARADGALVASGGTVSAIALIRQATTVPCGVTAGVIPVRRLDQVQITYTVAPTVNFLPA